MTNNSAQKNSILKVLPESHSLRGNSPFTGADDPKRPLPRSLLGLGRIVDGGLCHRCGSCVGICPTGVLGNDREAYPEIKNLSACTDCQLCVRVCPGDEFDVNQVSQELFGQDADLTATHGHFKKAVVAHAGDTKLRADSTSGGLVSALLIYMLKSGAIDGAVVVAPDSETVWKGAVHIARTEEEILAAAKSKYAISPTNTSLAEIRNTPGRYAVVGLPCQIHGVHKAAALDPRIKERIILTIGLFCHAAIEHEAFPIILESLGRPNQKIKKFTSRIGKHPGTPYVEFEDGDALPVYFPNARGYRPTSIEVINVLYRLYTPDRCMTCFDSTSEFADIAVGDPWMAPPEDDIDFYKGWSFALIRSERALELCRQAESSGAIVTRNVTKSEALASNKLMADEKRWRAFRIIETHRRQGKPIPSYSKGELISPVHSLKHFIKTELHILSHIFCYLPKWRARVLRFVLGPGGYYLFWLNSQRRGLRVAMRDSLAYMRRKIWGRMS